MASKCPVDHSESQESCPVDHSSQSSSTWTRFFSTTNQRSDHNLSSEREVSTIPKASDGNWVYPSEAQFFAAMARKNHNPQVADMKTIVPIHNAVNERAWFEVMKWESGRGGEACGGVKLVNFKGRPNDKSPRARWKMFLGYAAPFDRHDWVVDRCGMQMRYIIDFYTGRTDPVTKNVSFYLDVRPALDNWEAAKMRVETFCRKWLGSSTTQS
ncbi:cytochrome c/c1 heme-lyase [Lentinula aff. lateritia]|uniref:Cytochrome c/c1 heme-lyase n=1 Tax=Lentinula aff. lateritia TaxID=2804960 RepID=A0ACC1UG74_9AGAR|nr:cytochrome c/c1 heme-lyase [Lentinula aff. lateritia]